MADSIAPLSPAVLRNLADKLYEKRKTAALEVRFLNLIINLRSRNYNIVKMSTVKMSLHPIKLKYAASHHSSNFSEAKMEKGALCEVCF